MVSSSNAVLTKDHRVFLNEEKTRASWNLVLAAVKHSSWIHEVFNCSYCIVELKHRAVASSSNAVHWALQLHLKEVLFMYPWT